MNVAQTLRARTRRPAGGSIASIEGAPSHHELFGATLFSGDLYCVIRRVEELRTSTGPELLLCSMKFGGCEQEKVLDTSLQGEDAQ